MNATECRARLRAHFAGTHCATPASVYDALSARVASSVGFEIGMLAGSVASQTTLGAPDLIVLTLSELAQQIRQIQRAAPLSLIVDADHGYGNALNVMRTVEETEHAGISAVSIEDTALPLRFGQAEGTDELISLAEAAGKMRAAVRARRDPALIIAGRTAALKVEGTAGAVARAKAYADAGVDVIFIVGLESLDQIEAIHRATNLPIIVGTAAPALKRDDLAARGARILLQGHVPIATVAKALQDTYRHLFEGGAPAALRAQALSAQEMDALWRADDYRGWQREFLR